MTNFNTKYYYLNIYVLEILTMLLFNKEPIQVDKHFFSSAFNKLTGFEEELTRLNLNNCITVVHQHRNILISVKNRDEITSFLKEYVIAYKNQELSILPNDNYNYRLYQSNLDYMLEILDYYSQRKTHNQFNLDILTLYGKELDLPSDKIKARPLEFILDLYLSEDKLININTVNFKSVGISPVYSLFINLSLIKETDKIKSSLLFSQEEKTDIEIKIINHIKSNPDTTLKQMNASLRYGEGYLRKNIMTNLYVKHGLEGKGRHFDAFKEKILKDMA